MWDIWEKFEVWLGHLSNFWSIELAAFSFWQSWGYFLCHPSGGSILSDIELFVDLSSVLSNLPSVGFAIFRAGSSKETGGPWQRSFSEGGKLDHNVVLGIAEVFKELGWDRNSESGCLKIDPYVIVNSNQCWDVCWGGSANEQHWQFIISIRGHEGLFPLTANILPSDYTEDLVKLAFDI